MRLVGQQKDQPGADRDVLLRAAAGDERAARELFHTHATRLKRHAARILGPDDPDVDDVVQQAFLAALAGAQRFDGRSSLSTWLFGITTRRALDAARSRWRRRRWAKLAERVGLGSTFAQPDHSLQIISEAEALLGSLSPDQRMVFVMHDVEGYTFAEISGLSGVGISTLHGRLKAARARIERLSSADQSEAGEPGS